MMGDIVSSVFSFVVPDDVPWAQLLCDVAWWLGWVGGVGALLAGAGSLLWRWRARRLLTERAVVELVPSQGFDPSAPDMTPHAARLARASQTTEWTPRRAQGIRLRHGSDGQGQLSLRMEGPATSAALMRLPSLPNVQVRSHQGRRSRDPVERIAFEGASPLPRPAAAPKRVSLVKGSGQAAPAEPATLYVARAELVLARPDHKRLTPAALDPDPLQVLADACGQIDAERGEHAELVVDVVPVASWRVAAWRRRLVRRAEQRGPSAYGESLGSSRRGGGSSLMSALVEGLNGGKPLSSTSSSKPLPRQKDLADGVGKFLPTTDARVFAVQVLVRVTGTHPARAQARLHQVMAVMDAWSGENWWRPVGPRRTGWRPYSSIWWRRRSFDRRYATGEFAPARRQWVTSEELAALLRPATVHCTAQNVVRTGGTLAPAPRALPTWTGQPGVVPLGRVTEADGRTRLACLPQAEVLFGASFGKSGFGKSELALLQAITLSYGGFGSWFLDPHGAAIKRALPYLTHPAVIGRVQLIDLSVKKPRAMVAAWNPLSMEGRAEEEIQDVIGAVVAGLAAAQGWGDGAPRARAILSHTVEILAHLAHRMCQRGRPDLQPTLFTIPRLLTDEEWRERVLTQLPLPLSQFWRTTFPKYEGSAVPVVTQTIEQLATSTSLRAFLGQPRSTYDVRKAMDERQIVLLRCSGTGSGDQIITSLLLFDLFRAGHSREGTDPEMATLFAFADELKAIDGAARGYIAAILEQLRKYEVRLMAMTQMAMRLSEETRLALMQNQSLLTAAAADTDEATFLAKRLPGADTMTLTEQPKWHYAVRATLGGRPTPTFQVAGVPVHEVLADYHHPERLPDLEKAMDTTLRRRPLRTVLTELDGSDDGRRPSLDDRILAELGRRPAPRKPETPDDCWPDASSSEVA
ncbi:hypothetical protein [Streptomyces sp. NBC_01445]|uniref:hypothetical protein n=1 Tax=Streptomyces sp. NBC_01445 TaxID=2903869 RepID=UPI002DD88E80|nr:hypothetical protein [Streptomyces sp. NBC_01445]WSE02012.1 hypothetical protein OG574_00340 [Streptomyces sp. NBC_01445]WSE10318.1 hypothetical protein OG574_47670 [Streptomyces sp. NBC_01445]WSE11114.1 hypothetical protein OG574_48350 [Streptomyces sp. NBC_01445]